MFEVMDKFITDLIITLCIKILKHHIVLRKYVQLYQLKIKKIENTTQASVSQFKICLLYLLLIYINSKKDFHFTS